MRPSREVRNLILGYVADAARGDPSYRDVVSDDDDAFAYGSDAHELWLGGRRIKAIGRAQAAAMGTFAFTVTHLAGYEEGPVGWGACAFSMTTDSAGSIPTKITMVFHRENDEWKAVHFHTSHAVENRVAMGQDVSAAFDALVALVEKEHPDLSRISGADRLVTLMFTDIESSTRINEAVGDNQFVSALQAHNGIVRDAVAAQHGTVLKCLGDGFMIAFATPVQALTCAAMIQRAVAAATDPAVGLRVRMGVHTGRPVADDSDFFGRDVAFAARVAAASLGGEILVSAATHRLVETSARWEFDTPREVELRGFDGSHAVYPLGWS